ncbi:MAG: hypothetical protein H7A05_03820 [Pseudomonadales bacterium]|nr:hypothetical protein [Pseudomonadales bacterium]MCP5329737.1 hypothetical protein [Pseudomonadales bacterium]MCP5343724.1 hypothetical protein [Pseudomonadales bacterium]
MRRRITAMPLTAAVLTLFSSLGFAAGPAASIDDLAWMTGTYAGALGQNQLEENWIKAEGGSIAAMVRSTGGGATGMFEMITIEEVEGSLVLHIQQFNPGFVPRTPAPQKMELETIGDHQVQFRAVSEGGMRSLGYTKNGDTFTIHVQSGDRPMSHIELKARNIWN